MITPKKIVKTSTFNSNPQKKTLKQSSSLKNFTIKNKFYNQKINPEIKTDSSTNLPDYSTTINSKNKNNNNNNNKELKFDINEILQRRGISKSSRATDLKGGFKYNLQIPFNSSSGFSVKYTNKLIKDKYGKM
jgi:hypothetical protein